VKKLEVEELCDSDDEEDEQGEVKDAALPAMQAVRHGLLLSHEKTGTKVERNAPFVNPQKRKRQSDFQT
jgi:hypothetical protein